MPRVPLYIYFLALLFKFLGKGFVAARVAQMIMGAFNCVLVYMLGKKVFNRCIGAWAALVCSLSGVLIYFDAEFLSVGLTICLNLILLLALLRCMEKPALWKWASCGVLFGISLQTSVNIIMFFPMLCVWVYFFSLEKEQKQEQTAVPPQKLAGKLKIIVNKIAFQSVIFLFLGTVLSVLPFSLRNYLGGGNFVLLSSSAGINLYIGNNPMADGKSAVPPTRDFSYKGWEDNVWVSSIKAAERATGRKMQPSEVSNYWMIKTGEYVFTQPMHFIGLLMRKFYYLFNGYEIPENQSIYFFRLWSPLLQMLVFAHPLILFPFGIICPLALLGIGVSFKRDKGIMLLILFIAAHLLLMLIFFVVSRYRAPILPYFIMFAGAGLLWWCRILKEKKYKAFFISLAVFLLMFIYCNSRLFGVADEDTSRWFFNLGTAFQYKGDYARAKKSFEQAWRMNQNNPDTLYNLAVLELERGNFDAAIKHFQKVIDKDPQDTAAYTNIGLALSRQGKTDEAMQYYGQALSIDHEDVGTMVNLAAAYGTKGDFDDALRLLKQAQELNENFAPVFNHLGIIYENMRQDDAAEEAYLKAVEINPAYFEAYYNLAAFYERKGSKDKARKARDKAAELFPRRLRP
ncbi:MAG: tetratricopeptide repeat protein [Candidatus Omnitrophica bacterium]|nr:tetratricopeptide repeat protein [Candidatus Omnitrophota bacterium]MBU4478249.1 tetratricopeptide repeat protein [Candidatus Omnitrophota bacterium]MCG2703317.1 tetratricopeptide repeat protein [Candidatus Omnitrophota bacterium]